MLQCSLAPNQSASLAIHCPPPLTVNSAVMLEPSASDAVLHSGMANSELKANIFYVIMEQTKTCIIFY